MKGLYIIFLSILLTFCKTNYQKAVSALPKWYSKTSDNQISINRSKNNSAIISKESENHPCNRLKNNPQKELNFFFQGLILGDHVKDHITPVYTLYFVSGNNLETRNFGKANINSSFESIETEIQSCNNTFEIKEKSIVFNFECRRDQNGLFRSVEVNYIICRTIPLSITERYSLSFTNDIRSQKLFDKYQKISHYRSYGFFKLVDEIYESHSVVIDLRDYSKE